MSTRLPLTYITFIQVVLLLLQPALGFIARSKINISGRGSKRLRHRVASCTMNEVNGVTDEQQPFRLAYITDVEGNLKHFENFVAQSSVFDHSKCIFTTIEDNRTKASNKHTDLELTLRDGCYFVYGGDAVDKGPGDIRLCRALVMLKRRYPDRVFLLVGNRDLNKLRFSAELSKADMERSIDDIPPPHWDPKAPTLRQYLTSIVKGASVDSESMNSVDIERANTRVERLKYMLLHTLGCPKTFEFRRKELFILRKSETKKELSASSSFITDEEVVESFLYEVEHPEGSLHQYLQHADVVAIVGNTLFVHGAVDADTMRFIPKLDSRFENPKEKPPPGKLCDTVTEWAQEMNNYLRHGLKDYIARPNWDEARVTRGGESLMALQNRPAMWGRSVVSNCYGDGGVISTDFAMNHRFDPNRLLESKTNPLSFEGVSSDPLDTDVAEWLLKDGICRVVVGHKPTGDCPAVLSASYTGVEIVSADTSFSDTSKADNRGEALPVVELVGTHPDDNQLEIRGYLRDGEYYHSKFHRLHSDGTRDESVGDRLLGTKVADQWWVKAYTRQGQYMLCRGNGRQVEYKTASLEDIHVVQESHVSAVSSVF